MTRALPYIAMALIVIAVFARAPTHIATAVSTAEAGVTRW